MAAAAITLAATIGAQFALKESLTPEVRARMVKRSTASLRQRLQTTFARAALMMLMATGFLTITGWAQFESVFALWANKIRNY